MQNRTRLLAAAPLGALILLAGCNSQPETIVTGTVDPTANAVKAAPPVTLPPSLLASRTYRCKDNSLAYVDFFSDNVTADFRSEKGGTATKLTAPEKGKAFVADGYSVSGSGTAVEITSPGKASQSCHA
ncbi:hypothetical protein CLG96_09000 [Sphingomonas oleivorans]|uniref:C-type lysozyme inhibitor domain-containing protein n=1 Tax=Sphingomonas oleivorans TaxID=1735121 RepID=A0A2T5FYE8_9SPHN|nr:hypothetical protein [Sphingomonas oleivorans]PTQ11559.1 hypothetical protein CLG96_09000 [Sphingomonas oleivorans]